MDADCGAYFPHGQNLVSTARENAFSRVAACLSGRESYGLEGVHIARIRREGRPTPAGASSRPGPSVVRGGTARDASRLACMVSRAPSPLLAPLSPGCIASFPYHVKTLF